MTIQRPLQQSDRALRIRLRDDTGAAHARLDSSIGALTSVESYRAYLTGLLAFRAYVEAFLARRAEDNSCPWSILPLVPAIKSDLDDVGGATQEAEVTGLDGSLGSADRSYLLGVDYVLEGSALGARVLSRQVAQLGFSASRGARHLHLQTDDQSRWPSFLKVLETFGQDDPDAVARGARDAFDAALLAFGVRS